MIDYPLHPQQTHAEPLYVTIPMEEYEKLKEVEKLYKKHYEDGPDFKRNGLFEGTMHFIKLGQRYINLDAIAAIVPREKGLGYTLSFIGGEAMNICEMDMADIRIALEFLTQKKAI